MATPTTKATLKQYCLRALGQPVIEINVDDDQCDDRVEEALQYFQEYHYNGVERVFLKHVITAADLTRGQSNDSADTATDDKDGSTTAAWVEQKGWIPVPDTVLSVVRVFPFDDSSTNNIFDVKYQLRLNDLYDFSSTSIMHYKMTMQHLSFINQMLVGEIPLRHNQHQNRLYIDMDWTNDIAAGEYLIIEAYRQLDPDTYSSIWNDMYFKRYATALIKKQWGNNLLKFRGMQMLGGVEINGETILTEAKEELEKLHEEIKLAYDVPPMVQIG
jgi:hypothetical protein